jgi:hypothetical protein
MKPNSSKLKHQEEQHAETQKQQTSQQQGVQEFATVDDLLRHDASQVSPPPELAERLGQSVAKEPKPPRSWWQRIFGGGP